MGKHKCDIGLKVIVLLLLSVPFVFQPGCVELYGHSSFKAGSRRVVARQYPVVSDFRLQAAGTDWPTTRAGTTENMILTIDAVDARTCWACGRGGTILKTTDGSNWVQISNGIKADLVDMSVLDKDNVWIVDQSGTIFRTDDGGLSWTQIEIIPESEPTQSPGISAIDKDNAWMVDGSGSVLRTEDAGRTWLKYSLDPRIDSNSRNIDEKSVSCFSACDRNTCWVVMEQWYNIGDTGEALGDFIFRTEDGGSTWKRVSPYGPYDIGLIDAHSRNEAYILGKLDDDKDQVSLLRTDNGGKNWSKTPIPVDGKLTSSLDAVDRNVFWLVVPGERASDVYVTRDAGKNWQRTVSELPESDFTIGDYAYVAPAIDAVSSSTAWLMGYSIAKTGDGGVSWTMQVGNGKEAPGEQKALHQPW